MSNVPITVAHGDGIGPEIMDATLHILKEAGARIDIETIDIGEKVYLAGNTAGIAPESWDSLRRTKASIIYKATGNLPAVQILLGHTKIESTVRYLGVDVEDALTLAEHTEV